MAIANVEKNNATLNTFLHDLKSVKNPTNQWSVQYSGTSLEVMILANEMLKHYEIFTHM
jgi:hypothetical protein